MEQSRCKDEASITILYIRRLGCLMQPETEQETIQSSSRDLILSHLHDFSFQKIEKKKKKIKIKADRYGQVKHMLRGKPFPRRSYSKKTLIQHKYRIDEHFYFVMVKNSPHIRSWSKINLVRFPGNGLSRLIRPSQKKN